MDLLSTGVLTILGIGVFGGIVGATLFQRLRIPQVVGYIAMGLVIGEVGIGLVSYETVDRLEMLNLVALGIIGFLVGAELRLETFREHGRQLLAILLCEGMGASLLVGIPVGLLLFWLTGEATVALAGGIVFGAIASATDPASTLNVLWEYRCRGALTTTLIAIVALDDALAMTLYGIGTTVAQILTGATGSILRQALVTVTELGGAVALGVVSAFVLLYIARWLRRREKNFGIAIGMILVIIGVAASLKMDVILATMTMGVTLINVAPRQSEELFASVRSFAEPIYVIFFVLVGARLNVSAMPLWLWGLVGMYVVGRTGGKAFGAWAGSRMTQASLVVRRYTGTGLLAQGGVTVGLSIMAAHGLSDVPVTESIFLGDVIIFAITGSTLALQLVGPPLVKWSAQRAGEDGRDVKEEDVIETWRVRDAMNENVPPITEGTPLSHVFQIFSSEDQVLFPVVDGGGRLKGVISLDVLRGVVTSQETWDWVLAVDVMGPVTDKVTADMPLEDALARLRERGVEEAPVVESDSSDRVVGILDTRLVRIRVNEELVRRRQTAFEAAEAA